MENCMRTLILLGALLGTLFGAGSAAAWESGRRAIAACEPALCGGFAQNRTLMTTSDSHVYRSENPGQINVHWNGLRIVGLTVPHATFQVYYGVLINQVVDVIYLGEITVEFGKYDGPIMNGNAPYLFPPGSSLSGHFYFNDKSFPSTQFVTAITVK
jgi:hypothetical protein